MANGTDNKIIFRDGTSQRARMLPALDASYFSVEEHSPQDLIRFAQDFSSDLQFFELNGETVGDWGAFLNPPNGLDISPEDMLAFYKNPELFAGEPEKKEWLSRPHFTLFMAYLDMLKEPKAQFDDLTRRHLDYYFREVLRFQARSAKPDKVHVIFEPAKNISKHLVPQNTLLHAGKDATGKALHYALVDDLLVTQAKVVDVRRVIQDTEGEAATGRVHTDISWQEEMKPKENYKYHAFGEDLLNKEDAQLAELGFAVSSPILDLSEEERCIQLLLSFSEEIMDKRALIKSAFQYYVSTNEGWKKVKPAETENPLFCPPDNLLENQMVICLDATSLPAIVPNSDLFDSIYPVLKAVCDLEGLDTAALQFVQNLEITRVDLKVKVYGIGKLAIRNEEGLLNPKSAFFPFGSWPKVGSAFIFSHQELCKPIDRIELHFSWKNKPGDFVTHYNYYGDDTGISGTDGNFKVRLNSGYFTSEPVKLFRPDGGDVNSIEFGNIGLSENYQKTSGTDDPLEFPQVFKLLLGSPDFQHDNFTRALIEAPEKTVEGVKIKEHVEAPYTPEIQTLTLGYSTGTREVSFKKEEDSIHRFYHLHPFDGYAMPCREADKTGRLPDPNLLPKLEYARNLFIGLANTADTDKISLLLQLLPGITEEEKPAVSWSYLENDCWKGLEEKHILKDGTNGMLNAGLLRIVLPELASLDHHLMPAGLYWLKAAATKNGKAAGDLASAHTQAAEALWQDNGNASLHLAQPLPSESIKELVKRDPAIRTVTQPYTSFAGRQPEPDAQLYTRASERLRHKHRALQQWDYEHLVLDRFPDIYKVKCLQAWEKPYLGDRPYVSDSAYNKPRDGKVYLVVIPKLSKRAPFFPLEPRITNEQKEEIEEYLKSYMSPFANIEVRNPRFERIRYRMDVRFHKDYQDRYYQELLNQELVRFLSPWAYDGAADIAFGSRIYHASVIHFMEKLPYVDYVVNFKLAQQFLPHEPQKGCVPYPDWAEARFPDSILVSHPVHFIGPVESDNYIPAHYKGIGYDIIGIDHKVKPSTT